MSRKNNARPEEPKPIPDPASAPTPRSCELLSADDMVPSPDHIRSSVDPTEQADFEASIARDGILQPITVRPRAGKWEVVAGHRRLAAAKKAGLRQIPATVQDLDDANALRVQIIENSQRSGIHPLDEARGYELLAKRNRMGVEAIAHEVSRPVSHVYDRMKLLQLIPDARRMFTEGKFTLGHAVVLARLAASDQAKAMNLRDPLKGGLFDSEHTLFDPEDRGVARAWEYKPRSVAELQCWVDEHVRFGPRTADPMLFPETAGAMATALTTGARKVVAITFAHYLHPDARDGKTYGPRSWKRADGKQHSKKCDRAILGYVAAGVRRGEAFEVCIAKERCEVHWGAEIKARKRAAADRERAQKDRGKTGPARSQAPQPDPPGLEKALEAAAEKAEVEIVRQVAHKADLIELAELLRVHLVDQSWSVRSDLSRMMGKDLGEKEFVAWCRAATPAELKLGLACLLLEDHNGDARFLGVNSLAIRKEFDKKARQDFMRALAEKAKGQDKGRAGAAKEKPKKPAAAAERKKPAKPRPAPKRASKTNRPVAADRKLDADTDGDGEESGE